jgi:hypothetical protein
MPRLDVVHEQCHDEQIIRTSMGGTMSARIRLLALVLGLTGALLSVPSGVATAGHHADKASRIHFVGLSNNPNSNSVTVIGLGVIRARGVDKVINNHKDRFVFPKGVVVIKHHRTDQHQHFDKKACYGAFTEQGTWKAVGGTGAYAHASGGGTYKVKAAVVGCKSQPDLFQLRIDASGTLSF